MKRDRFRFLGAMACCAIMSMSVQAEPLYTIVHENGVKEEVSIEVFYPTGGPTIEVKRNQTTVSISPSDIVRMERLTANQNRFKVTFVTGDIEELCFHSCVRIEGQSRVPGNPQGRWGRYCASMDKITLIERAKGG